MIKGIIFDVDGVLLDSFESNHAFFSRLMTEAGHPPPSREQYAGMFHKSMREVIAELTDAGEEEVRRVWEMGRDRDIYVDIEPGLTAGSVEVVRGLSEKYPLGIVTGRVKSGIEEYFELSGLRDRFKAVVGYEDTERHKPDPEPILLAAKLMGFPPAELIYVGDAATDIEAAHGAGMRIAVYSQDPPPGGDWNITRFEELPGIVDAL